MKFYDLTNIYDKYVAVNSIQVGIYLQKVKNRNTRRRRKICSKLTIKTPERRQWRLILYILIKPQKYMGPLDKYHQHYFRY